MGGFFLGGAVGVGFWGGFWVKQTVDSLMINGFGSGFWEEFFLSFAGKAPLQLSSPTIL